MLFRDEGAVMELGGIHDNTVLFYFARSPFFDMTSNNHALYIQALHNVKLLPFLTTRAMFEGRLKTMSGLEYLVAEQPAEMAPGTGTGIWVIRKQTRRKRPGAEDEITVHASYFLVGDHIYQAPSVADVLGSKLVCAVDDLIRLWNSANKNRWRFLRLSASLFPKLQPCPSLVLH
jgi:mediator of RNA polymerase II transcription subunit 6